MALAPATSSSVLQRMQSLQTEVAQSVGKNLETCIQKINALRTLILETLLEEEQKKENSRKICDRVHTAMVSNGLPPSDGVQKLFERAQTLESQSQFYRTEHRKSVDSYHKFALEAACRADAELCNGFIQKLITLGTQVAGIQIEERDHLSPLPKATAESPSDLAAARARRIELYRAENFASEQAALRLADDLQRLKQLYPPS